MGSKEIERSIDEFLEGKTDMAKLLFYHFVQRFNTIGEVVPVAAKTMIGLSNGEKRIAWVTQLGKNFVHIVFPFRIPYPDNLCFTKIAQVPGNAHQFNHHFRMYAKEDINEEVMAFMKMAFLNEV